MFRFALPFPRSTQLHSNFSASLVIISHTSESPRPITLLTSNLILLTWSADRYSLLPGQKIDSALSRVFLLFLLHFSLFPRDAYKVSYIAVVFLKYFYVAEFSAEEETIKTKREKRMPCFSRTKGILPQLYGQFQLEINYLLLELKHQQLWPTRHQTACVKHNTL